MPDQDRSETEISSGQPPESELSSGNPRVKQPEEEAFDPQSGILYEVPRLSFVEDTGRHEFWRADQDPVRLQMAEIIYQALCNAETKIDIGPAIAALYFPEDPIDLVASVFYSVKDTDPRFFFYKAGFIYTYEYYEYDDGSYSFPSYVLQLEYLPGMESPEARAAAWEELNAAV